MLKISISRKFLTVVTLVTFFFLQAEAQEGPRISLSDLEQQVFSNSAELKALRAAKESADARSSVARAGLFPKLSATAGVGEENLIDEKNKGYTGYVSGTWNLFRSGKDSAEMNVAESEVKIANFRLESKQRELLSAVRKSFYKGLAAQKVLLIKQKELEHNREQKKLAQRKVGAGLTSSVDVLEFDLREDDLLSEMKKLETELQEQKNELAKYRNDSSSQFELVGEFAPLVGDHGSMESSIQSHPEILLAAEETTLSEKSRDLAYKTNGPELNFEASYGRITLAENDHARWNESEYLLSLTIPLFDGFETKYKTSSGIATFTQKQRELDLKKLDLSSKLKNLRSKKEELVSRKEILKRKLERSKKYYDLTASEYKRGIKNSPDLVGATEQFFDVQKDQVEIDAELSEVQADLMALTKN